MTRWNPACSNSQLPEISSWVGCDPVLSPGVAVCHTPNNNDAKRGQPSVLLTTGNPLAGAMMSSIMEKWEDCIPWAVLGINDPELLLVAQDLKGNPFSAGLEMKVSLFEYICLLFVSILNSHREHFSKQ